MWKKPRDVERWERTQKMKMRHVHVPTNHNACIHCVLQTCTNKKKKKEKEVATQQFPPQLVVYF